MDLWRGVRRLFDRGPVPYPTARRHSEEEYELLSGEAGLSPRQNGLPNGHHHPPRRRSLRSFWFSCLHCWTLRRALITFALIPIFFLLALLWGGIPPGYKDIREYEQRLPQHNLSLPFPEGRDGMYLRFPAHLWGHGLNNILQETILMSYLAYMANRSFVFEDYTWSHTPFPYTIYDFALRPARVPLNSFISGPTAGGPMPVPRAINTEYWEKVCPRQKIHSITSEGAPNSAEGDDLIKWWVERLKEVEDGCVEVSSPDIFDRFLFGGPRILSLWSSLAASPILADYTWSPLVQSAVSRNFALLQPLSAKSLFDISSKTTLQGLVAVHLRRGDYKRHCPRLADWGSLFMGLNQAPTLPDRFDPSNLTVSHAQLEAYYLEHCLPTVDQIVARLRAVREEHPELGLRRVYVLTNGWGWWVSGLKKALVKDGWDDLKSSLDLVLDGEQEYVAMAVDMAIAEKAEVFVGNGFSSLTSNVVMLRMAKGLDIVHHLHLQSFVSVTFSGSFIQTARENDTRLYPESI